MVPSVYMRRALLVILWLAGAPTRASLPVVSPGRLSSVTPPGRYDEQSLTLGICTLVNTETNVAEQFALFQFFRANPLIINGVAVDVLLTDQPYFTHFAITGTIHHQATGNAGAPEQRVAGLRIWREGSIGKQATLPLKSEDQAVVLGTIYNYVAETLFRMLKTGPDKSFGKSRSMRGVLVDPPSNATADNGAGLLPGHVPCPVPPSGFLQDKYLTKSTMNVQLPKRLASFRDPLLTAQLGHAQYYRPSENYFLLRNSTVPEVVKDNVRRLAFPVWRRPGLPLTYMAAGEQFEDLDDLAGAANAYFAALVACNRLNTSPYEKAALKQACFGRLAELARQRDQPQTAVLMELARQINITYLESAQARTDQQQYYTLIERMGSVCNKVEAQAREVRAEKRRNGFMAILNTAASIGSAANGDQAGADQYAAQAVDNMSQSGQLTAEADAIMTDISVNFALLFDDKVEEMAESSTEQIMAGQTYLAREITYHLLHSPLPEVEQLLLDFTADKKTAGQLLMNYFAATTDNDRVTHVATLRKHLMRVETQTYLYESRGNRVPANLKKGF